MVNNKLKMHRYGNRGNYYDFMTSFAEITGNASLARYHYQKAYEASVRAGCNWLQAVLLNRLAMVGLSEKKYSSAGFYLDMSESRLKEFNEKEWKNMSGQGFVLSPLGKISDYFMAQRERYILYRTRCHLASETNDYKDESPFHFQLPGQHPEFRDQRELRPGKHLSFKVLSARTEYPG